MYRPRFWCTSIIRVAQHHEVNNTQTPFTTRRRHVRFIYYFAWLILNPVCGGMDWKSVTIIFRRTDSQNLSRADTDNALLLFETPTADDNNNNDYYYYSPEGYVRKRVRRNIRRPHRIVTMYNIYIHRMQVDQRIHYKNLYKLFFISFFVVDIRL